MEDLRILVIDLDPQSSATMFLSHKHSIGIVNATSAQAMLQNVSREELLEEFIVPSVVRAGLTLCLRRLTMPLLHPIGESCAMSIYRVRTSMQS